MSTAERRLQQYRRSLVGFTVGAVEYALPIGVVREVVVPSEPTPLPHAPRDVVGVVDHRGEVIPLVDLRVRFDVVDQEASRSPRCVMIRCEGRSLGLIVDGVTEVFGSATTSVGAIPELGGGEERRGIAGVVHRGEALVFVLNAEIFAGLTAGVFDGR